MSTKKMWSKIQLKITSDQVGLMVGKRGAVLFGDIQTPSREEYLKFLEENEISITYPNTNFKVEFPSSDDKKVYIRWTCPRIIHSNDTLDRKAFDRIVVKHIKKVQSRILSVDEAKSNIVKYEKTFRVRACSERRRVGMFIGNGGENVNRLKKSVKETLKLKGRVWIDILEEGDEDDVYMDYEFDDDTDDSAWFTVKFNYPEEESITHVEVESIIEKFLKDFDEDSDDEELLDDDEMISEW